MEFNYTVSRNYDGSLSASTDIPLETLPGGKARVLHIYTNKKASSAQACVLGVDSGFETRGFTMFHDYFEVMLRHEIKRATKGAIEAAHRAALAGVAPFIAAAKTQYDIA